MKLSRRNFELGLWAFVFIGFGAWCALAPESAYWALFEREWPGAWWPE